MAREMKDSGIEWIGEIPRDWKLTQLKRFVTVNNGREVSEEVDKADNAIPVYGSGGVFKYTVTPLYVGETVMFGRKGTLGKPIYANEKFWTVDTMYYLTFSDELSAKYNYYQLSAFDWEPHITHTALPSIVGSEIVSCRFAFPSKQEQLRIVSYLDAECSHIDAVIEKTRASIEEYKKLKQAVILQAVTKGILSNRPMKDSNVEWISSIPIEWSMVRGKGLFKEVDKRSDSGTEELLTVSQYTGVTPRSQKNVNMFEAESLVGYKICEVGDIAANTMWLWAGAIGVSNYRGVISPSYNIYQQKENYYNPAYLDYLLRIEPLVQHYESRSTGIRASRLRLYPQQFLSIFYPVPPKDEQEEIVRFLKEKTNGLDQLIRKKGLYLSELEAYKKSLIFEYVTGKKEVPA